MDNVAFKYAELASVSVKQLFYANGLYKYSRIKSVPDFELAATDECIALMQRLDMVLRSADRTAGFTVFARVLGKNAGGDDLLRFPPKAGDKLSFWMKLRNPNVLNFDDLPVDGDFRKFYYFSNQQLDGFALRSDLHLGNAASGVNNTNDRVAWSAANYRFHHSAEVAGGAAKVTHMLSGMEVLPDSVVNQAGQADIVFNLNALPLGKCRLSIGGSMLDEFYFIGNPPFQPFGVIELSLADALATNYRIVETDRSLANVRPAYSILFQNRKTRWRYTVHLQPESPLSLEMSVLNAAEKADFLSRLNIVSNDAAIAFTRTSTSDTDIIFVSDSGLALQEKYFSSTSVTHDPLSLTLKKYIGVAAKETVVRSDLSYPQTDLVDATTPPFIYSDIFLTL
jgi:hypothetical protein